MELGKDVHEIKTVKCQLSIGQQRMGLNNFNMEPVDSS